MTEIALIVYASGLFGAAVYVGWALERGEVHDAPFALLVSFIWPLVVVATLTSTIVSYFPRSR